MTPFLHQSRPGFYGLTLPQTIVDGLTTLANALLPGDATYPSASQAHVVQFIEQRASEADLALLRKVVEGRKLDSSEDGDAAVAELEQSDPLTFAALRELVYHGYYASLRVLAAMTDRGYGYHGAPQPLGYEIAEEMAIPTAARGSYVATEAVTRATL